MNWRRLFPSQPNLPNELIIEIISWLPVKTLIRFRSVNKSFNSIISNPFFVQMHLKKSARNPHLALMCKHDDSLLTFPISNLLDKLLPTTVHVDPYYQLIYNDCEWWVVGSCNGLLCLIERYASPPRQCLSIWNPATGESSEFYSFKRELEYLGYSFGYDNQIGTFQVVEFRVDRVNTKSLVRVSSLGDTCWRYIQCFPVLPLHNFDSSQNNGVHLSGTINWLALRDYSGLDYFRLNYSRISIERYVILSLDLSTETYTQLLLPRGFDKVPHHQPMIVVLMDCLCFCHDFEETHFVIWQLKDFGLQESWIQLYNISYKNLFLTTEFKCFDLLPLHLSENGDTLILTCDEDRKVLTYNCRDNRVENYPYTRFVRWSWATDYVESLVSTC